MKSTNVYLIMWDGKVTLHTDEWAEASDYLFRAKNHGFTWETETLGTATIYKMANA